MTLPNNRLGSLLLIVGTRFGGGRQNLSHRRCFLLIKIQSDIAARLQLLRIIRHQIGQNSLEIALVKKQHIVVGIYQLDGTIRLENATVRRQGIIETIVE